MITEAWSKIPNFWPIDGYITINPLAGLEQLDFNLAIKEAQRYFEIQQLPPEMLAVNRFTIKWLLSFIDQDQAAWPQLERQNYKTFAYPLLTDGRLPSGQSKKIFAQLPSSAPEVIEFCLKQLDIAANEQELFLTLQLTTLSGWAAIIKQMEVRNKTASVDGLNSLTHDFLALRLLLCTLLYPQAKELCGKLDKQFIARDFEKFQSALELEEEQYQRQLIAKLKAAPALNLKQRMDAQLLFCIDVRSESLRYALEKLGSYETFGIAGHFALPIEIEFENSKNNYSSCPPLVTPLHKVVVRGDYNLYQKIKLLLLGIPANSFASFGLSAAMGLPLLFWQLFKSTFIVTAAKLESIFFLEGQVKPDQVDISQIPFAAQLEYAKAALMIAGLTSNFSKIVIFCGHTSQTRNNASASSLNCGACAGHDGLINGIVAAKILNDPKIRKELQKSGITIPDDCRFAAAKHTTTTGSLEFVSDELLDHKIIKELKAAASSAQLNSCQVRFADKNKSLPALKLKKNALLRSLHWSEVHPEWGQANCASLIIGPRQLTSEVNLLSEAFLHSYEHSQDKNGTILRQIMNSALIVSHWISSQYFFSAYDNVSYGAGSKVTKNLSSKLGIIQGVSSDLMHGLPLQSVYETDTLSHHKLRRLLCVINAPSSIIMNIVEQEPKIKELVINSWIKIIALDPSTATFFALKPELSWAKLDATKP